MSEAVLFHTSAITSSNVTSLTIPVSSNPAGSGNKKIVVASAISRRSPAATIPRDFSSVVYAGSLSLLMVDQHTNLSAMASRLGIFAANLSGTATGNVVITADGLCRIAGAVYIVDDLDQVTAATIYKALNLDGLSVDGAGFKFDAAHNISDGSTNLDRALTETVGNSLVSGLPLVGDDGNAFEHDFASSYYVGSSSARSFDWSSPNINAIHVAAMFPRAASGVTLAVGAASSAMAAQPVGVIAATTIAVAAVTSPPAAQAVAVTEATVLAVQPANTVAAAQAVAVPEADTVAVAAVPAGVIARSVAISDAAPTGLSFYQIGEEQWGASWTGVAADVEPDVEYIWRIGRARPTGDDPDAFPASTYTDQVAPYPTYSFSSAFFSLYPTLYSAVRARHIATGSLSSWSPLVVFNIPGWPRPARSAAATPKAVGVAEATHIPVAATNLLSAQAIGISAADAVSVLPASLAPTPQNVVSKDWTPLNHSVVETAENNYTPYFDRSHIPATPGLYFEWRMSPVRPTGDDPSNWTAGQFFAADIPGSASVGAGIPSYAPNQFLYSAVRTVDYNSGEYSNWTPLYTLNRATRISQRSVPTTPRALAIVEATHVQVGSVPGPVGQPVTVSEGFYLAIDPALLQALAQPVEPIEPTHVAAVAVGSPMSARLLGLIYTPVIVVDPVTPDERRARAADESRRAAARPESRRAAA